MSFPSSEISVDYPVLPEPENPGFLRYFQNPKPGLFLQENPGFFQAKNGRFRAILSHKMAQIVPKDLKPFVIFI